MTEAETLSARDRADRIHAIIRDRICLLDYPPGMRLSETALASEFGISRTPLRRVLGWLEDEGLLTSRHGVGTFVTVVDYADLAQVYELRKEIAVLQTRLSPRVPGPGLIAEVEAILTRAEVLARAPSARAFSELDRDMFLLLLRLTQNQPLREMAERLYFRTARIWLQQVTACQVDLMQEIEIYARETRDILTALRAGDLDAVGHLRRAHISQSFARMQPPDPVIA